MFDYSQNLWSCVFFKNREQYFATSCDKVRVFQIERPCWYVPGQRSAGLEQDGGRLGMEEGRSFQNREDFSSQGENSLMAFLKKKINRSMCISENLWRQRAAEEQEKSIINHFYWRKALCQRQWKIWSNPQWNHCFLTEIGERTVTVWPLTQISAETVTHSLHVSCFKHLWSSVCGHSSRSFTIKAAE